MAPILSSIDEEISPCVDAHPANQRISNSTALLEKDGSGIQGDVGSHGHGPLSSFSTIMSLVAMAILFIGSQLPLYFFGAIPPYIYSDIGGEDRWTWIGLANLLALAAVCPFVGSLSDIMGRRYVALAGALLLILGIIVASTAKTMNVFIGGMAIAGAGAGINELTALAVTGELAPTRKRGIYVALLVFSILPFAPSILWAQLIAYHAGWRYCGALCGAWAGVGFIVTAAFYFPSPRANSQGLTKKEVISRIDYVGGFLSIVGMVLFMTGLQWGGYQYKWASAHVLTTLLLGACLIIAFFVWELWGAAYPMFPRRIAQNTRVLALTLLITFISGANFFSILFFWPTQAYNVYGHDPVGVGLRGLPLSLSIIAGAFIVLWLLSVLRGHNQELMVASSVMMTAGVGSLAVARPNNMSQIYGLLVIAGLGIGGIVIPASVITTIICPDELIATAAALTLAIRVIGGTIGYATYFNVFIHKFIPNLTKYVGGAMVAEIGVTDLELIEQAILLTSASLLEGLKAIPGISGNDTAYAIVLAAGQTAYAESYKYVYLVSIAFGATSIIASLFLGDIHQYMDDHVAVVMH